MPKAQKKTTLQITRPNGKSDPGVKNQAAQLLAELLENYNQQAIQPVSSEQAERDFSTLVGTLPDWAIIDCIRAGIIKIDPLPNEWEESVDEVSIDFHLGNKLRVFSNQGLNTIDLKYTTREEMESMMQFVELKPGQPFVLTENDFVIATTKERLTLPDDMIGHLHGKSSLARLGIVVHSTAARFDPGWDGCPVLEFGTFLRGKKLIIYEGMPICAFSFEKMGQKVDRSYKFSPGNRYGGSDTPKVSNIGGINVLSRRRN